MASSVLKNGVWGRAFHQEESFVDNALEKLKRNKTVGHF